MKATIKLKIILGFLVITGCSPSSKPSINIDGKNIVSTATSSTKPMDTVESITELSEKTTFTGSVYNEKGELVDQALVSAKSVESNVSWVSEYQTTIRGVFVFRNAPIGAKIEITVSKNGISKSKIVTIKPNLIGDPNFNKFNFGHSAEDKNSDNRDFLTVDALSQNKDPMASTPSSILTTDITATLNSNIEKIKSVTSIRFWYTSFWLADTRGIELNSNKLKYIRYNNRKNYETIKDLEMYDLILKENIENKYFYDEIYLNDNLIFQNIVSELNVYELNNILPILPNVDSSEYETLSDGTDSWIELKYLNEKNEEKYLNVSTRNSIPQYNDFLTKIKKFREKMEFIYSKFQEIDQINSASITGQVSKYKRSFNDKLTASEIVKIKDDYFKRYSTPDWVIKK